jgi:hypothetical protein
VREDWPTCLTSCTLAADLGGGDHPQGRHNDLLRRSAA